MNQGPVRQNGAMSRKANAREAFMASPYFSTKHESYFKIYDEAVAKVLRDGAECPVVVEIGILHGGSLFMWREIFGESARIIGIDLNPEARKWEAHGFEIFIGNQAESEFWEEFYAEVGLIDFLVDDGGHTNRQQIVTTIYALKNVSPGGIILIEDTDTSFNSQFGNPSKRSFINYSRSLIENLYGTKLERNNRDMLGQNIERISFLDSIVLFEIKDDKSLESTSITNNGSRDSASDFRYEDQGTFARYIKILHQWSERKSRLNEYDLSRVRITKKILSILSSIMGISYYQFLEIRMKIENYKLRRYW